MNRREKTLCRILLLAIIAFSVVNTAVWVLFDTRPPRWDEAYYLTLSLKHHAALTSGGVNVLVQSLFDLDRKRPPLVPALAVLAHLLFGRWDEVAVAVNLAAFVVALLAVYGLGARLVSCWGGLLAAFLLALYPGVFSLARLFVLDFCDMALVALALYYLIRTAGFSHRRPALALGLVVGLGLLCRAFFPIFLLGPLGLSVYGAWRAGKHRAGEESRPAWQRNSGLALLICLVVAAPWYLKNMAPLVLRSLRAAYGKHTIHYGPKNSLTVQALVSYFLHFANIHLAPMGVLLFVLALCTLWRRRSALLPAQPPGSATPGQQLALLLAAIVIPYAFFSTLPSQDIKNIIPVLPAMAVVTAWGLCLLQPPALKQIVLGGSIVWFLCQFWLGTYGWSALPAQVEVQLAESLPPLRVLQQGSTYPLGEGLFVPRQEKWSIPEILSRIAGGSEGPGGIPAMLRPAVVAILPNHPFFNASTFSYFSVLKDLPVQIEQLDDPWDTEAKNYRLHLLAVDFVVTKSREPGPQWLNRYNEEILAFLRSPASGFVEVEPQFALPDGSQAVLYAARGGPTPPPLQAPTPLRFSDQIALLGYQLEEQATTGPRRAFLVTFYWQALRQLPADYHIFAHVTKAAEARIIARWDHDPMRGRYPTSLWQPGVVIEDRGLYFLPAELPAGSYPLRIGLHLPANEERLKVTQAAPGLSLDDDETRVVIATIHIP